MKIIYSIVFELLLCNSNLINYIKIINNQTNLIQAFTINSNLTIISLNKKRNLIFTIIVNYPWKKILPFIKSLFKANFGNCDIVIFISKLSKSVINNLKSYGVIIIEIPFKIEAIHHIYKYRWKLYMDFLKNNKNKYNLVLSVDIKDTIIQKEFFCLFEKLDNFLGFSFEDIILNESINKGWILNTIGIKSFESICNERIINAGTIWGTLNQFLEFSNILYQKLQIYPEAADQSVVNYLIYHEKILKNSLKIISDEFGPVMTIGLTKRKNINLDSKNNILNYKGQVTSIVHQYDRHPDLKRMIKIKYCPELIHNTNIIDSFILLQLFTISLLVKSIVSLKVIKINEIKNFIITNRQ